MKFFQLITSAGGILSKNSSRFPIKYYQPRFLSRHCCIAMDQGDSVTGNGVVEKTASQLKKEAQKQAKMEKFAKKKEKAAAVVGNQNQVSD